MTSDTNSPENAVQDGLQHAQNPVSRDPEPSGTDTVGDLTDELARDDSEDEASGTALGVNEAVGPAEDEDRDAEDERDLTTDISPSD